MSFEQEWAAHKAAGEKSARMRLDGAKGPGGGSNADLTVHDDELGRIGNMAFELHGRVKKKADDARSETHAAAIYLLNEGGFDDLSDALLKVNDNWNTQVTTLKNGFGLISNHLDFTRKAHAKDERDIVLGMENPSKITKYFHNDSDTKRT
ncbi:hypothetical protein [Streptomyces qinglanensis]|uniref:Uncharacterized protein n=1 Tax=Streptomyces qinglanensis TaxID=943816 RepID=A0A1H9UVP4_9ACTN|nr:hypothetical protein [Streptomyces qinglanensis]SES13411.1 hypothetical protein SAMN05421870_109192 [Streptomyces qinglanensis]